tara:strand:+ start:312 stop:1166 length:855 start_codon:yes stop_codon:yes gene_type:complete
MSKFKMDSQDWDKIIMYAKVAWEEDQSEIGGMLIASKNNDGDFVLSEPVILKQQVSGSNTILDKEALAKYYSKTAIKHAGKDIVFVWWHSHHTMAAFWSGTDLATIDTTKTGSVSMSLVVNLKEEYLFRVNIWQPIEAHQDLTIDIIRPEKKIPKSIVKEYKKLCSDIPTVKIASKHKPIIPSNYYYSNNNYWNQVNEMDQEYTQLESVLDDMLTDYYCETIKYKEFNERITALNEELEGNRSELRVKETTKREIDKLASTNKDGFNAATLITVVKKQLNLWGN